MTTPDVKTVPYRVLARKYRPGNFSEVIGQDTVICRLKNAIDSGRIPHAYLLTGIRGTGKTTIARLIARALNYTGPDGKGGPTTGPTDDCKICSAIAEDSCTDVREVDVGDVTGVENIRRIIEDVHYAPSAARNKIYIIDEVHGLAESSKSFGALLQTLEEPPSNVIFIFSTTEIRKVPITIQSRCQRFDLRRVDLPTLTAHYAKVCVLEKVQAEEEALGLIARAADGSVRDGLSLLDQAIALGDDNVSVQLVRDMLGMGDRQQVLGLLENALTGDCVKALDVMDDMFRAGTDPVILIKDLLSFTHLLTRLRAVSDIKDWRGALSQDSLAHATVLAASLNIPVLDRAWQILLKGLREVSTASNPQVSAESVIIQLINAVGRPDAAKLLKTIN